MGKLILQVDILAILALAWNHPILTGGLVLMFTPPLFPVVVFFSPLLISTALCAVALVSVGHQIESTREREIAGWNARVVEGDRLSSRIVNIRRRRVQGEERWLDWVQGVEPGSLWNNTESLLMDDIKEEGLKADFRADEGGIEFLEEDYLGRQIEAYREYERSFSFRTGAIAAASTLESFASSREMIPFTTEGDTAISQIPPIFLYNLRTGGTGTRNINNGAVTRSPSRGRKRTPGPGVGDQDAGLLPFGSFDISGMIDADDFRGEHQRNISVTRSSTSEPQVSDVAALMNNVAAENVSLQRPITPDDSLEDWDFGFTTTAFGQDHSDKSAVFQRPVSSRSTVVKDSEESLTSLKSLRLGNAVIYNASSESGSAALERHGSGAFQRKLVGWERRVTFPKQKKKHIAREKSTRHPFQLEIRTADDWKQMKSQTDR